MAFTYNPLSGMFDITGNTIPGNTIMPYATFADFPAVTSANNGQFAVALDTGTVYEVIGGVWTVVAGPADILSVGTIDSQTPSANGAVDHANQLIMQSASGSVPGLVNNTTQTFSGQKTFSTGLTGTLTGAASLNILSTAEGAANGVATLDGGGKVPLSQLPATLMEFEGNWNPNTNTPSLADGVGTTGFTYWVSAADSGTVPGLSDPSMTNFQIGNLVIYNGTAWVQVTPAAGVQSVNGAQGAVVLTAASANGFAGTYSGTALTISTTVNSPVLAGNGTAISAATTTGSGSTVVLNNTPTLITPNIGAATGTSLSVSGQLTSTVSTGTAPLVVTSTTQVANLNAATAGSATTATTATNATNAINVATTTKSDNTTYYPAFVGANSSSNQGVDVGSMTYNPSTNTLTATQFAGNASTVTTNANLTGDVTSVGNATTLSTVNTNTGTFASVTVNGKGLVTAAANLTGDITSSSATTTLATVNTNVGSFGSTTSIPSFTVNGKGLITAAGGNVVVAPAGTLSGTTLNSTVVTSSLTSVGTIGTGTWAGTTVAINHGGTGVTSVTTAPTASSFAGWDANSNLSANNLIESYATTVTAAGTTTLTVSSAYQQYFTGTTTQTVVLPVANTLALGQSFQITNLSTGLVTVQSSGTNTVQIQGVGTTVYTCILTSGTTAASWSVSSNLGAVVPPTVQKFTSGSGTYTTPANVAYIRVRMVGGGGGSSGSGASGTAGIGGTGGNTLFGTSLLVATGGGGGQTSGGAGGGGVPTISSPAIGSIFIGGAGGAASYNAALADYFLGGMGGNGIFGGGPGAGPQDSFAGTANTGAGASGPGTNAGGAIWGGGGGGAGGGIDAIIPTPSSTYSYTVGAGGTAGTAGTGTGNATGAIGGSGYIEVTEYYLNAALGNGGAIKPTMSTAFNTGSATGTGGFVSGTYTSPANCIYIEVEMVGGGGGSSGSGTSSPGTPPNAGGNTTFDVLTAGGGGLGTYQGNGGSGGTPSGMSSTAESFSGGKGGGALSTSGTTSVELPGGNGGSTPFGSSAFPLPGGTGIAGVANTGTGASGGSTGGTNLSYSGSGGGGGAYIKQIYPPGTYTYSVGAGGSAGTAGGSGYAGGAGGSGAIIVKEYYGNGAIGTATNVTGIVAVANGGTGRSSVVNSSVRLDTFSQYGATNTKVIHYTNSTTTGTDLTLTASTTNGDKITVNTEGIYSINACTDADTGFGKGIVLNGVQGTISIFSTTLATRLTNTVSSDGGPTMDSWTGHFNVNDYIWLQTDGAANTAQPGRCLLTMTKVF